MLYANGSCHPIDPDIQKPGAHWCPTAQWHETPGTGLQTSNEAENTGKEVAPLNAGVLLSDHLQGHLAP